MRLKAERRNTGARAGEAQQEDEQRRRIAVVYLLGFFDMFGVGMIIPLLPKLARNLGASPTLAGLIGSIYGAMQVFSGPIMGQLSDVYGRRAVLLLCWAGPAAAYCSVGISGSLLVLLLARIPCGLFKHGLSISKAYLADTVPVERRQSVLGLFNACNGVGFIFGPIIGGYLADRDPSLLLSMLACGAIFWCNTLIAVLLLPPSVTPASHSQVQKSPTSPSDRVGDSTSPEKRSAVVRQRRNNSAHSSPVAELDTCMPSNKTEIESRSEGENPKKRTLLSLKEVLSVVNVLRGDTWHLLGDLILLRFLMTFGVIMFRNNFPIFLEENFGTDHKTLGWILSLMGVASSLAGVSSGWIARFYTSHWTQILHSLVVLATSMLLTTLAPSLWLVVVFLLPASVATANLRICFLSLMLQRGHPGKRGEIMGVANSVVSLSRMVVPSLVGVAQESSSVLAGYLSFGFTAAALVLMLVLGQRQGRRGR